MSDARTRVMQILDTERHYHVHTVTSDLLRLVAAEIERLTAETCDLTARVDLAQQNMGVAEAERDEARALLLEFKAALDTEDAALNEEGYSSDERAAHVREWVRRAVDRANEVDRLTAERDEARALLARCLPAIPPSWPSWMALRADVEAALGKEQTNE